MVIRLDIDRYVLPGIVILVVLILIVVAVSLSGNSTFQTGNVYFEYPNTWTQDHVVGNFSNDSVYSEVTLTSNFQENGSNTKEPGYIIVQMQKKSAGVINIPSSSAFLMNTTNSSTSSFQLNNMEVTQMGSYTPNVAKELALIENGDYYYTVEYICPPYARNQTEQAYNTIVKTLKIS
jgi:hypothetical protein